MPFSVLLEEGARDTEAVMDLCSWYGSCVSSRVHYAVLRAVATVQAEGLSVDPEGLFVGTLANLGFSQQLLSSARDELFVASMRANATKSALVVRAWVAARGVQNSQYVVNLGMADTKQPEEYWRRLLDGGERVRTALQHAIEAGKMPLQPAGFLKSAWRRTMKRTTVASNSIMRDLKSGLKRFEERLANLRAAMAEMEKN
jgi:hypothetical protein